MALMQSLSIQHFESTFFSSEITPDKFYGEFNMIHWYAKSMRCRVLIFGNILTARMNMELVVLVDGNTVAGLCLEVEIF